MFIRKKAHHKATKNTKGVISFVFFVALR